MGFSRAALVCIFLVLSVSVNEIVSQPAVSGSQPPGEKSESTTVVPTQAPAVLRQLPTLHMGGDGTDSTIAADQTVRVYLGHTRNWRWRLLNPDSAFVIKSTPTEIRHLFEANPIKKGKWTLTAERPYGVPDCLKCTVETHRNITVVDRPIPLFLSMAEKSQTVFDHNCETFDAEVVQKFYNRFLVPGSYTFLLEHQDGCNWDVLTTQYNVVGESLGRRIRKTSEFLGWEPVTTGLSDPIASTTPIDSIRITTLNAGRFDLIFQCNFAKAQIPVGGTRKVKSIKYLVWIDSASKRPKPKASVFVKWAEAASSRTVELVEGKWGGDERTFRLKSPVGLVRIYVESQATPWRVRSSPYYRNPGKENPSLVRTDPALTYNFVVNNVTNSAISNVSMDYVDVDLKAPGVHTFILQCDLLTAQVPKHGTVAVRNLYYIIHVTAG